MSNTKYQHKNSNGTWEDCTEQDYNDCHKDFRRAINTEDEIKDEFRMIISHALLGCDTSDVDKETWELVFSECAKYAQRYADQETVSLKEKLNQLIMDNMTYEYNEAEAEKFAPEYENQIREDERNKFSESLAS